MALQKRVDSSSVGEWTALRKRVGSGSEGEWTTLQKRVDSGSEGEWTTLQKRVDSGSKVVGSLAESCDRNRLFNREARPRLGLGEWLTLFNKSEGSGYPETFRYVELVS